MALIKCRECGTEISDQAAACIKCGAPVKPTKPIRQKGNMGCGTLILGAVGFVAVMVVIGVLSEVSNKGDDAKSAPTAGNACQKDNLQCLGDKGVLVAGGYCRASIEALAKYSVKWTDGMFNPMFGRFRWQDQKSGIITYVGDKAEFQNGFGAYMPVIYECDMSSDNKTVLDVRVSEGRLPQ